MAYIEFILDWKLDTNDFAFLNNKEKWFSLRMLSPKNFITSYNNVPLIWSLHVLAKRIQEPNDLITDKIGIYVTYIDGPSAKLNVVDVWIGIATSPDMPISRIKEFSHEFLLQENQVSNNIGEFYLNRFCSPPKLLEFRVKLNIASADFDHTINFPDFKPSPDWASKLFEKVDNYSFVFSSEKLTPKQNDNEEPTTFRNIIKYSDLILISNDDKQFYCHRVFLGEQSEALAAMFDAQIGMKESREGIVRFPTMNGEILKSLLRYLYVGFNSVSAEDFSVEILLGLLDAAEQYELKDLKLFCIAPLWRRIPSNPEKAVDVVRTASLMNLKELKFRALDILADNYTSISLEMNLYQILGDDLCRQLMEHMAGKLRVRRQDKTKNRRGP